MLLILRSTFFILLFSATNFFPAAAQNLTYNTPKTETSEQPTKQTENISTVIVPANLKLQIPSFFIPQTKAPAGNLEETYTYQVKRQLNPWHILPEFYGIGQADEAKDGNHALEERIKALEMKTENLTQAILSAAKIKNETDRVTNETIQRLKDKNQSLLENIEEIEELNRKIQHNISSTISYVEKKILLLLKANDKQNEVNRMISENATSFIQQLSQKVANITNTYQLFQAEFQQEQLSMENLQDIVHANNQKITEIKLAGGAHWAEQTKGCGGILISQAGIIAYKLRQQYESNERCVWTIRTNRRSHITLKVLEDGFQNKSKSDFISITEFKDGHSPALGTRIRIESGDRQLHTFKGPVIFVTFFSDSSIPGNGFLLTFEGMGNSSAPDSVNTIRYSHFHYDEAIGQIAYPVLSSNDIKSHQFLYQPNELATIVINPKATSLKVIPKFVDMEKETNCEYDSVNFYISQTGVVSLGKKYCYHNEAVSSEVLRSTDGFFIVTFGSDGSNQFKGFQFSWDSQV